MKKIVHVRAIYDSRNGFRITVLELSCACVLNPLTPKITDFLTDFWPLLTKRKREYIYIMTKPSLHNVFGSPLSIYEAKITLSCTGKPIWRILFKKVPKI